MGYLVKLIFGICLVTLISLTSAELLDAPASGLDSTAGPEPATAETPVKRCKDDVPRISPEEPLHFDQISGAWYAIRIGPPCEGMEGGDVDCSTESYWRTGESAKNEFSYLVRYRGNGTYESTQGVGHVTPVPDAEQIDPLIIFSAFQGMPDLPCTVIGTDKGMNWLVWACCFELKGNTTTIWSIMSRAPTMDAKLEQTLVEYVETHGKVPRDQLAGVGHTHCYGSSEV